MGKIVRIAGRTTEADEGGGKAAPKLTSFFSRGIKYFLKWFQWTDRGYRKAMIGGVWINFDHGCPKKVRRAIVRTEGVMRVRTDLLNQRIYVMGKNMSIPILMKNVRKKSKFAEILDILPWDGKY